MTITAPIHWRLTDLYQFHRDYDASVRKKFPCPDGYREIEFLENLPEKTMVFDRVTKLHRVFYEWNEVTGDMRTDISPGLAVCVGHCWYVVKD